MFILAVSILYDLHDDRPTYIVVYSLLFVLFIKCYVCFLLLGMGPMPRMGPQGRMPGPMVSSEN